MEFDTDTFPSIRLLVQQIEKVTGKPVLIDMDASLGEMISTHVTARTPAQAVHVVKINTRYQQHRHALASVQLRHILHRYAIKSPEKDITLGRNTIDVLMNVLQAMDQVPAERLPDLAKHLAGGLVIQLRSALPSVAVHYEIQKYQPELAGQQEEAIKATINNNLMSLKETGFPEKLVRWNRLLAATESFGLASIIKNKALMVPFEALGLLNDAKNIAGPLLLGEYENRDDRELVDITARKLQMTELYQWI